MPYMTSYVHITNFNDFWLHAGASTVSLVFSSRCHVHRALCLIRNIHTFFIRPAFKSSVILPGYVGITWKANIVQRNVQKYWKIFSEWSLAYHCKWEFKCNKNQVEAVFHSKWKSWLSVSSISFMFRVYFVEKCYICYLLYTGQLNLL